jgi:hypothetical protein
MHATSALADIQVGLCKLRLSEAQLRYKLERDNLDAKYRQFYLELLGAGALMLCMAIGFQVAILCWLGIR